MNIISTHFACVQGLPVYKHPYENRHPYKNRHPCPSTVVQSCHCAVLEVDSSLLPLRSVLLHAMNLNNDHPTSAIAHCATRSIYILFCVCVRKRETARVVNACRTCLLWRFARERLIPCSWSVLYMNSCCHCTIMHAVVI